MERREEIPPGQVRKRGHAVKACLEPGVRFSAGLRHDVGRYA